MPWPAPTNPCPKNQKVPKKFENSKIKKKKIPCQPATTAGPILSNYDFFYEIYTLALPGIRTAYLQLRAYLPYHYTTQSLVIL